MALQNIHFESCNLVLFEKKDKIKKICQTEQTPRTKMVNLGGNNL